MQCNTFHMALCEAPQYRAPVMEICLGELCPADTFNLDGTALRVATFHVHEPAVARSMREHLLVGEGARELDGPPVKNLLARHFLI